MHILIIPSWYPQNSTDVNGSFFREQALALANNGHKVGIIYPQLRPKRAIKSVFVGPCGVTSEIDEGLPTFRFYSVYWFPRMHRANTRLWVRGGLKTFEAYTSEHGPPDLIHAHSLLDAGLLAHKIKTRHEIPFILTEHRTSYERGLFRPWQKILTAKVLDAAAARLAVSAPFAGFLCSFFDDKTRTWQVVPNILSSRFEDAVIKKNNDQTTGFTFCNISFLNPKKGLDLLLSAFAKGFKGDPSVRLVIGGDGAERGALEFLAIELGIKNQVDFLGMLSRPKVLEVMSGSQAYVLSSHIETFGVAIIESLALGNPVVATRCGGPESIVRDQDGLLVEKNNVPALAAAMKEMIENYSDYDREEIRQSCIARFGEKAVTAQLTEIYEKALSTRDEGIDG